MKKLLLLVPLGALMLAGNVGLAQDLISGTWKVDMSQVNFPKKPDVYVLMSGMYECKTCTPPYRIKADGMDQAVTGHPYFDSVAITVVSPHEVKEVDKKGGKVVATSTTTISPDGKTAWFTFSDASDTNGGPPVTGKGESELVEAGPAGSHAVSGSWRLAKIENMSDNATVWSYQVNGDHITMKAPTGQTYTAKMDGSETPMHGDPGVSSVEVKMLGKNVLQETDKRGDKVISVFTFTVAPDGKTAKAVSEDKLEMLSTEFKAVRQ
jgi:hypothetical protein